MSRTVAYLREAFDAIWLNRTRSILTMLGMIIGTSSVIAVLGISKAATSGIGAQISSFGVFPILINPDDSQDDPNIAQIQYRDLATVANSTVSLTEHVEPVYGNSYDISANRIHSTEFVASGSGYHPDSLTLREGRRLAQPDVDSASHVCLISDDLADKFFPSTGAVGKILNVGGTRFLVIGVYNPVVQGSLFAGGGGNTFVEIPYTAYHRLAAGPVPQLQFYALENSKTDEATNAVIAALQHIHGTRALYSSQNGAALIGGFQSVIGIVAAGLTAIGGVALAVAGIGIMNIMLVSVTERTREIGIRKAIGASRRDITLQFLMEALLLALGGGATGMLLGILVTVGMASIISKTLGAAIIPYVLVVSVALAFSIGVGMLFGLYPAIRASRMDPVEALRS